MKPRTGIVRVLQIGISPELLSVRNADVNHHVQSMAKERAPGVICFGERLWCVDSRSHFFILLGLVEFLLTEPVERDPELGASPETNEGEQVFARVRCAVCHLPALETAPAGSKLPDGPKISERLPRNLTKCNLRSCLNVTY